MLSCWNINWLPWKRRCLDGSVCLFIVPMYDTVSMVPSHIYKPPVPWALMHPQTIIDVFAPLTDNSLDSLFCLRYEEPNICFSWKQAETWSDHCLSVHPTWVQVQRTRQCFCTDWMFGFLFYCEIVSNVKFKVLFEKIWLLNYTEPHLHILLFSSDVLLFQGKVPVLPKATPSSASYYKLVFIRVFLTISCDHIN